MSEKRVNSGGNVNYGYNVVKSIVLLATKEIGGVSAIKGRGVKLEILNNTINIDVYIEVASTATCNDIAYRVQENIKRSVESMTDYVVGIVNVNILSVNFNYQS